MAANWVALWTWNESSSYINQLVYLFWIRFAGIWFLIHCDSTVHEIPILSPVCAAKYVTVYHIFIFWLLANGLPMQGLRAINLGDSGFVVVRDGCTVFRSPVQQHDFNFTYQLEYGSNSDLPSSGQVGSFIFPCAHHFSQNLYIFLRVGLFAV